MDSLRRILLLADINTAPYCSYLRRCGAVLGLLSYNLLMMHVGGDMDGLLTNRLLKLVNNFVLLIWDTR